MTTQSKVLLTCKICETYQSENLVSHIVRFHKWKPSEYKLKYSGSELTSKSCRSRIGDTKRSRRAEYHHFDDPKWIKKRASKIQASLQNKFGKGVTSPMHVPKIRSKVSSTHKSRTPEEIQNSVSKSIVTSLKRYGVVNPSKSELVKSKIVSTVQQRYGTDNVMRCPEVKKHWEATFIQLFGVSNPMKDPQVHLKFVESMLDKYGYRFNFENTDILRRAWKSIRPGKTVPEEKFERLVSCPNIRYTGMFDYKVVTPTKVYYPDFVVDPIEETKIVIEIFGAPHYSKFRQTINQDSTTDQEHEQMYIQAYAQVGYTCVVIWAHELDNVEGVNEKIKKYV